jgi:hypothetical protein
MRRLPFRGRPVQKTPLLWLCILCEPWGCSPDRAETSWAVFTASFCTIPLAQGRALCDYG